MKEKNKCKIVYNLKICLFLLITCLYLVCSARMAIALNGADVAIYNDSAAPLGTSGAWQEGITAIKYMLTWMGLTYEDISYQDLNNSNQDFSSLYKVLHFPGGSPIYYNYWISKSGRERIHNFVRNGGGYFGICAGAFFAADIAVWDGIWYDDDTGYNAFGELIGYDLDLFPGSGIGPINGIAYYDIEGYKEYNMATLNFENENTILSCYKSIPYTEDILYYGGPYFSIDEGADVEVLATYEYNGEPAIVACQYESGKVVLSGPHPEIEEDSFRDGVTLAKEYAMYDNGSDWNLILHILNWMMNVECATNEPLPEIKANGSDDSVTISPNDSISITVNLDPGIQAGQNADWWIAAYTPFDWFSYVYPTGWQSGISRCIEMPLADLDSVEVLNITLPLGDYIFYFAVDDNADGQPDANWWDFVEVHVQ